jgi:hypothetical protein
MYRLLKLLAVRVHLRVDLRRSREAKAVVARDPIYGIVLRDYERNLRSIARHAKERGDILVLCELISNLRDWEPNSSVYGSLPPEEAARLETIRENLEQKGISDKPPGAAEWHALSEAAPEHAGILYSLAGAALREGDTETARQCFTRARDLDAIPWRAPTAVVAIVEKVAREEAVPLVPLTAAFFRKADQGIPGYDLFADNVHPNLYGQYLFVRELLQVLAGLPQLGDPQAWNWSDLPAPGSCLRRFELTAKELSEFELRIGLYHTVAPFPRNGYAGECFQRALDLDPTNADAAKELQKLRMRADQ